MSDKKTVAECVADFLIAKEIEHVFGYLGGAVAKLIDEMVGTKKIQFIQNYHEQASALAADAYARVNHKIGVAIATSGPGATNLVTGIANAQLDSIPTLFITGQDYYANVSRDNKARLNGFQDLDIVKVVEPITKYAVMLERAEDIRYELEKCYAHATSGRPGAVLIDIPLDIQFTQVLWDDLRPYQGEDDTNFYDLSKCGQLLELIQSSKRPVILAGGGIQLANSSEYLKDFSQLTNIPVVTTLNGVDAMEGAYSFAGLHGNLVSNIMVRNADLIIALGTRFGQRQVGKDTSKYSNARVVHVDIDIPEFNRVLQSSLNILSPLDVFFEFFLKEYSDTKFPQFLKWNKTAESWKDKYNNASELNNKGVKPVIFSKFLIDQLPENSIVCADVGQNQMWVAQAFSKKRGMRLLNSSGLGAMGYSLPAAIGSCYARPTANVVCTTGDGGLQMNIQELMLISHKNLNVKIVVYNNNTLGMMREAQERYYGSRFYGANEDYFRCVDIKGLAAAYGLDYIQITRNDEFDRIKPYIESSSPCIIELVIDIDSKLSNRYDESLIIEKNILND